jgi:CheY-like chemotaxis protein
VLVVDDEEDARELMVAILTSAGAQVATASSVPEALRQLDAARPDVLLSDVGMPGADGYSLIREVRKRDEQSGRHLPAAAITAYAGNHDRERAITAGFDGHLAKPVSRSAILDVILSLCGTPNRAS